ncbi:MAG: DUF1800 domain-containing protein, partial [Candidatus Kapabacteria bacterium]|nr:DUF1800 domain-containing protein [Candidatus Kapabacteria bacterium]
MDAYTGVLDEQRIRHLLRRTTFALTPDNIRALRNRTADTILSTLLADTALPSPPINPMTKATWHDKPYDRANDATYNDYLKSWWAGLMLNEGVSLREKMTL